MDDIILLNDICKQSLEQYMKLVDDKIILMTVYIISL